ncbi:hypothetical protein Q7P35_010262 [Cladosporium inversicolor]
MAWNGFDAIPIELNQSIASYLESDKDLASFRLICKSTHDAVDADACSFWRRRFKEVFETASLKLTGLRAEDGDQYRKEYQARKKVLHVIDAVFQRAGQLSKLQFAAGTTTVEKEALRVLRDLILDAFSDKSTNDLEYQSKNIDHILAFVSKTNLLRIVRRDDGKGSWRIRDTSFLHAIQVLLAPILLGSHVWLDVPESGFHGAQMAAYADNVTAPIFIGSQGLDIDMSWLLKNVQFWRHHFVSGEEALAPAFAALEDNERPQWWSEKLSQGPTREIGNHWKGCYAFVERREIRDIRLGRSGQGSCKVILDHINCEDNPHEAFQNINLAISDPADVDEWRPDFEHILNSLRTPQSTTRTRAQHRDSPSSALRDFRSQALRFEGDGIDDQEGFFIDGWLNPLPRQHGVPGWQRLTMMKYFIEEDEYGEGVIDTDALWAYEGVMLPGGKMVVGRWWCPIDGTGQHMYSGPFILWNVESSKLDADDECIPLKASDGSKEKKKQMLD